MTWFAFKGYTTINLTGIEEKNAVALGFHGYSTEAEANANPNSVAIWQKAALNVLETESAVPSVTSLIPGGSELGDIGDFFHRLTESSTWIRVGEVIFGGIILWAGVKALTSQTAVGAAASGAKNVAKKPVKAAAKVAVPEARYGTRLAAKRVAPKTTRRVAAHRAQVKQYGGKRPYNP
jgi:hypothetical protein